MANPRQRRKSRSSSYKPISRSRRAKKNLKKTPPIRGPKVLQDAWDHKKTVRQNYAALGLVHMLNPLPSGGFEPIETAAAHTTQTPPTAPLDRSTIPPGHGRIIRDDAGNILRFEVAEGEEESRDEDREMDMEDLEPKLDEKVLEKWVGELGEGKGLCGERNVVSELERLSTANYNSSTLSVALSGSGPRHSSFGEVAYLERLVKKYGGDVERMAWDRKLNPEQRTVGELRRGLKRAGLLS